METIASIAGRRSCVADNFLPCLQLVLKSEGGNDDNPRDPGGRTSRGITQTEYDCYCEINLLPKNDVWSAPEMSITAIYLTSYWEPWCPKMPIGIDYVFFDMSVNTGQHEAIVMLQRALNVTADGHIGHVTLASLYKKDPKQLVTLISLEREAFYRSLRAFRYFGKGWLNRVKAVEADALAMIAKRV